MNNAHILIVDDESDICKLVAGLLEDEGYRTSQVGNDQAVFDFLDKDHPDLILLDIWLEGSRLDGLGILKQIKADHSDVQVVMMSGHGNVETAVSAIHDGAYDFIEKPFKTDRLLLMVKRALEAARMRMEKESLLGGAFDRGGLKLVGATSSYNSFSRVLEQLCNDIHARRIWISGANGTGKNATALSLYEARLGQGYSGFYRVSCKETQANALQSMLVKLPQKSVVYFDEIEKSSKDFLSALLAALRVFDRDLVMIASSALRAENIEGQDHLLGDIYKQLSLASIFIPSLQDMKDDIPVFAQDLWRKHGDVDLGHDVLQVFKNYDWPGNISQLQCFIGFLKSYMNGNVHGLNAEIIKSFLKGQIATSQDQTDLLYLDQPLKAARGFFEANYLQAQLERFEGNISKTAEFVGMDRAALHRKMKHLQSVEQVADNGCGSQNIPEQDNQKVITS